MRIISRKKIHVYSEENPQAELPLTEWYFTMRESAAKNLHELRQRFYGADAACGYTIFNIGGNNYRLVTAIHYNRQLCYLRTIWTHAEYSKPYNQAKLK